MSATNIITASFNGRRETWASRHLWQWDYGQVLQLPDLELPDNYQVHFSNYPIGGQAYVVLGSAGGVSIPDTLLTSGLPVYAYVFLQSGADDGETVYKVFIPVDPRPKPSEDPPTPAQQSALDEAIAALNAATEDIQGQIDNALQEAKDSGEFDGADGNGIWYTYKQVDSVPSSDKRLASISYMVGRSEAIPAVDDFVYGPPADSGGGTPTFLYRITEIQGGTAVMVGIGSMKGTNGTNGVGVPTGGTAGQVLAKASGSNYDTEWVDQSGATIFDFVYDEGFGDGEFVLFPTLDEVLAAGPDAIARFKYYGEDYETYLHVVSNEGAFFGLVNDELAITIYANGNTWVLAEQFIGGGGTTDYTDLSNKPSIDNVTLSGNKSLSDLGIQPQDFLVTITYDSGNDSYSSDKTFAQIKAAWQAGKNVILKYGSDPTEFYHLSTKIDGPFEFAVFSFNQGAAINQIMIDEFDLVLRTVGSAGTYSKPSGGIPASDLASAVQTSLGKADTAYQKPSGGIPASDLASGVIPTVPSASDATPQALGTAAAGSSANFSRADHVHAMPSASDVGAVAVAQGVAHAGEFVVVGSDGNITTVTMSVWQGGSY